MQTDTQVSEIVIIGGGVMGAATACFLARDHGARVTVLEPDPTYREASSALSASSIRQQFSTPINIALSQASLAFLRDIEHQLAVDDALPAIGLVERGYLYLATAAGCEALAANHSVQRACGVDVAWLDRTALAARFGWLAVDDLAAGSLGLSGEGWFDGPALLQAFVRKARSLGVRFVAERAAGFERAGARISAVLTTRGARHAGEAFVLTAGAWSAPLARLLDVDLPVRARKRDVFVFRSPAALPDCPLVIDPAGFWFRPDGTRYLCGAPPRGDDADDVPLDRIDHGLFDELLWPALARRVPAFEALRMERAWAGYYEMNTADQNALVGPLPGCDNAFTACGFSGHGMQQAPAVGRALAERIACGRYRSIDLSPLSPARLAARAWLVERNVI
ncbi:MAG: FAD-binding oxidoreductase [Burkholderiaceae bacterium]|jgi:glycine/D-amino acid oxidase-like deaminating enzyme|nr:FAD-binding oxidoreductase [Burkholderiaceae bacterium]